MTLSTHNPEAAHEACTRAALRRQRPCTPLADRLLVYGAVALGMALVAVSIWATIGAVIERGIHK